MSAIAGGQEGCAVCGAMTNSWCSACKTVYYCSATCQTRHWTTEHKAKCSGLKSQQEKGGKRNSVIALVDKVLFPYDNFIKLFNMDMAAYTPRGLINCGNSCYANVILQCLAHTRPLMAYLLKKGHRRYCTRKVWCFLCELEVHMDRAIISQKPFSPVNILSRLATMGGKMGYGRQEDAHEFMRFAVDMMQSVCLDEHGGEKLVHPKAQETTLIQHIFGGQLCSQVKCTRCNHVSNRFESMMDLTIEIQGDATSLEECLDQFTKIEWLDGDNKYKCDRCEDYVIARKRLTIHHPPNVLTIALKRFMGGFYGKINKKISFPERLILGPYSSEEKVSTNKYELYAVVVHVDMLNASYYGHYICYTKGFHGDWYRIDDEEVTRVELYEVLSQGAYMLLYRRISARPKCLKTSEAVVTKESTWDTPSQLPSSSNSLKPCSSNSTSVSDEPSQGYVSKLTWDMIQQIDPGRTPAEHSLPVDVRRCYQDSHAFNNAFKLKPMHDLLFDSVQETDSSLHNAVKFKSKERWQPKSQRNPVPVQQTPFEDQSIEPQTTNKWSDLSDPGDNNMCESLGARLVHEESVGKLERSQNEPHEVAMGNAENSEMALADQSALCDSMGVSDLSAPGESMCESSGAGIVHEETVGKLEVPISQNEPHELAMGNAEDSEMALGDQTAPYSNLSAPGDSICESSGDGLEHEETVGKLEAPRSEIEPHEVAMGNAEDSEMALGDQTAPYDSMFESDLSSPSDSMCASSGVGLVHKEEIVGKFEAHRSENEPHVDIVVMENAQNSEMAPVDQTAPCPCDSMCVSDQSAPPGDSIRESSGLGLVHEEESVGKLEAHRSENEPPVAAVGNAEHTEVTLVDQTDPCEYANWIFGLIETNYLMIEN